MMDDEVIQNRVSEIFNGRMFAPSDVLVSNDGLVEVNVLLGSCAHNRRINAEELIA